MRRGLQLQIAAASGMALVDGGETRAKRASSGAERRASSGGSVSSKGPASKRPPPAKTAAKGAPGARPAAKGSAPRSALLCLAKPPSAKGGGAKGPELKSKKPTFPRKAPPAK